MGAEEQVEFKALRTLVVKGQGSGAGIPWRQNLQPDLSFFVTLDKSLSLF